MKWSAIKHASTRRLRQLLARSSSHDAAEQQRLQPSPEEPAGEVEEELGGDFEDFLGLHDDVDALAASIAALPSDAVVVVAWEHSVLTDIAAALGVRNPPEYPSDEFDWQWTVRHGQLTQANEKC